MESVTFNINNEYFELQYDKIPQGSLLHTIITTSLNVNKDKNGYYVLDCAKDDFIPVYEYLKNNKIPSYYDIHIFDYFNIDLIHSYELSSVIEENMRCNMYMSNLTSPYTDNYHGLIKITKYFWEHFKINKLVDNNLLFKTKTLTKTEWSSIVEKLKLLKSFTDIKGVFIAGGSIFSILFGLPINDIDIFLYGINENETVDIINKISKLSMNIDIIIKEIMDKYNIEINKDDIINYIDNHNYFDIYEKIKKMNLTSKSEIDVIIGIIESHEKSMSCIRTKNAITFKNRDSEIQIVLRLYQTPSEILHGFDVDSCCLGYDGNDIWMTQRAHFSLKNGYNTVNFNRLSPSYELRLAKYGSRGMAIKIPNFNINKVNDKSLIDHFNYNKDKKKDAAFYSRHHNLSKLHNIDKLLYLNYYCEYYNYKKHSINMINKLNHEKSDYAAPSFVDYKKSCNGSCIYNLIEYFYDDYINYLMFNINEDEDGPIDFTNKAENDGLETNLQKSSKYLKSEIYNTLNLITNSIRYKFQFIKGDIKYLNLIINIPDLIYDALNIIQEWDLPSKLKFKTVNPGEQMTNTFHQIILENNNIWYEGEFYKAD